MTEVAFIDAIVKEPHEPIHRQVYADWLEERGDQRAEFLRLQLILTDQAGKGGRKEQVERLRELQSSLDPHWIALMIGGQKEVAKGEKKRRSRREMREADVSLFLQQYGRRGHNDRRYDRGVEDAVKRMKAEDLDRLLRGEDG
jgi:uncharacterized protein (TIGR02996 family)